MESQIFIFFISVYCLNKVACYHQYLDYRNEAYPQRPDWSNNQDYPQNLNPVYSHHQPEVNYGPLKHVANYAQSPTEAKYAQRQTAKFPEQKQEPIYVQLQESSEQQHQQLIEDNPAKIQSDANHAEQPPAPMQQTYQEESKSYSDSSDRSYGASPQIWQQAPPPNPVYRPDSYPQQVSRQWPPSSHLQPVPSIPQKTYPRPMAYWQSGGYQKVPEKNIYYDRSPYDEKPIFNTPVRIQSQEQATSISANNFRELLASNPKVKEYLATHDKRFLLIHPNGMTEHVDVLDESLLGNSQRFKSSDIFIEKDVSEKNTKNLARKNLVHNLIGSTTQIPDSHNINRYPNKPHTKDFEPQPSNIPEALNQEPKTELVIEYPTQKYYNSRLGQIHTYKENHVTSSILPADKPMTNNNHRNNSVVEHPKHPIEISVHEKNITSVQSPFRNSDINYLNPSEPQESKTNIIEGMKKSEEKEFVSPLHEQNNRKHYASNHSYPIQTNSESNSNSSSSKTVGEINYHQNKTFDSSPSNDQNGYAKSYEVPDESNKTTITLPYYLQNPPNDSDTVIPTFETPKNSDYDDISFIIYNQKQAASQSNDDTSSDVGDVNSTTNRKNVEVTTGWMGNQGNLNYGNTNPPDFKDYDTVDETKPRISVVQSTDYENVTDNNNQQSNDNESKYLDTYLSSTTADEITTLPPVERKSPFCENCATDDDQTKTDEILPAQPEIIGVTEETNPDDTIGDHKLLVGGLKNSSKPFIWFFKDELSSESDIEDVYVLDLKFLNPKIERISKSVSQNGTTIEEIEETIWEHKDDKLPRQRRFTKIITYPGPEHNRQQKTKTDETENNDAVVPKRKQ